MPLTIAEVEHIAELARLALSDEEKELYAQQLSDILDYAERLQKVDTGDVPPLTGVLPLDTVLRDDVAQDSLPPAELLKNTADKQGDSFRVNAVLD